MRIWPGTQYPLGATWDGEGVNFALFSENATAVELCLFDKPLGEKESYVIRMRERTHRRLARLPPRRAPRTTVRVPRPRPIRPRSGTPLQSCQAADRTPYAKAISGPVEWNDALFGYTLGDSREDLAWDPRDSAQFVPKSVVVDSSFAWGDDRHPPNTPGRRPSSMNATSRDRRSGIRTSPSSCAARTWGWRLTPSLTHLLSLGVTAVELMRGASIHRRTPLSLTSG